MFALWVQSTAIDSTLFFNRYTFQSLFMLSPVLDFVKHKAVL